MPIIRSIHSENTLKRHRLIPSQQLVLCAALLESMQYPRPAELIDFVLWRGDHEQLVNVAYVSSCTAQSQLDSEFGDQLDGDSDEAERNHVALNQKFIYAAAQMRAATSDGQWMGADLEDEGEELPGAELAEYMAMGTAMVAYDAWWLRRDLPEADETMPDDLALLERSVGIVGLCTAKYFGLAKLIELAHADKTPYLLDEWTDAIYQHVGDELDKAYASALGTIDEEGRTMPVTWKTDQIANEAEVCHKPDGSWAVMTLVLVEYGQHAGFNRITEQSSQEVFRRLSVLAELWGAPARHGDGSPWNVTLEDVKAHIGLVTNWNVKSTKLFNQEVEGERERLARQRS